MRIQHNVTAMNSYRNFSTNNSSLARNLEKLSSGYKINRAGDDAAGLAISEKMRAQISGLEGATKNAKDGISLVQTAEGALTEVHDMLNRMYTLAEQSANGTYEDGVDRAQLQKEVDQLRTEIDRIADSANFNGLKLLNGDLGAQATDSVSITDAEAVDFTDGINVTDSDGLGAKSTFKLTLDKAFSEGDTLTLNFQVPQAGGGADNRSITLTKSADGTTAAPAALNSFNGSTVEEQLRSIKSLLENSSSSVSDVSTLFATGTHAGSDLFASTGDDKYTISIEDNSLVFTANKEAETGQLRLTSAVTSETTPTVATTPTAGVNGTAATAGANAGTIAGLIGGGNLQAGDKVQFEFKLKGGTAATATVEITDDMLAEVSDSGHSLTTAITEKLKNTTFDDNETTRGVDESQYKVADIFDVSSSGTTITIGANSTELANVTTANEYTFTGASLSQQGGNYSSVTSLTGGGVTVTAGATAAATVTTAVKAKNAYALNKNLADGDTFTLKGKLEDGRSFSVEMTARSSGTASNAKNEFAIGATKDATITNLATALNSSAAKVTVGTGDDAVEVSASEIFGTNKMFKVDGSTTAGTLSVENNSYGVAGTKGLTGAITSGILNANASSVSGEQTVNGVDQGSAKVTMTFNKDELEYGTSVTIGKGAAAKTFELVHSDTAALSNDGNIRVVVEDLENSTDAKVAEAFRDAINNELITNYDADTNEVATSLTGSYTSWAAAIGVADTGDTRTGGTNGGTAAWPLTGGTGLAQLSGNTLTLTSKAIGSSVSAMGGANKGGVSEGKTIDFLTDDDGNIKLKAGDTIKINGNTYQFDTTTRNLQGDNKLIKVSDFYSKEAIANAVKLAVEEEDKTVTARINDDFSVTVGAANVNGTYTAPTVEETLSGGGLTLQIGDTSEDFNKLTVNIRDMHTDSIGTYTAGDTEMKLIEGKSIKDIDIGSQEGAAEALDVIKNAINMVSDVRGTLGASQNRLEHTINNLGVMRENIQNAESAIRDTDVAEEMMAYTKNNILVQSAQAMLAQANQLPQGVLQLLG